MPKFLTNNYETRKETREYGPYTHTKKQMQPIETISKETQTLHLINKPAILNKFREVKEFTAKE